MKAQREFVVLGGGCFWGVEEILRNVPGVIDTEVGYAGGTLSSPRYEDVKTGRTGHAEVVRVEFDPTRLELATLLDVFFRLHDPTTPNRQGNDVGTQYRSVIFVESAVQRREAEAARTRAAESKRWGGKPLATEILDATSFYPAEGYHQDYLVKNPGGYTCHWLRD
jgi:peptide methionine sulfoxide reductase msrA/msrB